MAPFLAVRRCARCSHRANGVSEPSEPDVLAYEYGASSCGTGGLASTVRRLFFGNRSAGEQSQGRQRQFRGKVSVDLLVERLQARGALRHSIGAAVPR